jgi:hypothetical protein
VEVFPNKSIAYYASFRYEEQDGNTEGCSSFVDPNPKVSAESEKKFGFGSKY